MTTAASRASCTPVRAPTVVASPGSGVISVVGVAVPAAGCQITAAAATASADPEPRQDGVEVGVVADVLVGVVAAAHGGQAGQYDGEGEQQQRQGEQDQRGDLPGAGRAGARVGEGREEEEGDQGEAGADVHGAQPAYGAFAVPHAVVFQGCGVLLRLAGCRRGGGFQFPPGFVRQPPEQADDGQGHEGGHGELPAGLIQPGPGERSEPSGAVGAAGGLGGALPADEVHADPDGGQDEGVGQ